MLMVLGFPSLRISCASTLGVESFEADTLVYPEQTMWNIVPKKGGQNGIFLRFKADLNSGCGVLEIVGAKAFDWYLWKSASLKVMYSLWAATKQKRPHRDVTEVVGDAVMPWPSFFDLGFDFEKQKAKPSESVCCCTAKCFSG